MIKETENDRTADVPLAANIELAMVSVPLRVSSSMGVISILNSKTLVSS
jgi:hypothetical protein